MATGASRFEIRADAGQYVGEINKAKKSTDDLSKSQSSAGKSAKEASSGFDKLSAKFDSGRESANKFAKYIALAGVAMTTALVKSGLESADALAKTSDKLGIATEKLAGLQHAAILGGESAASLDKSLEKMSLNMVKASAGTGSAVKALDALGLSAKDLVRLSPDKQMAIIADKLQQVDGAAAKAKIAFDIFGKSGVGMVNVLADGSAGLEAMQKDAELAGLALSRIDARQLEIAGDQMDRVAQQTKGFGQQLALQMAPLLAATADAIFGVGVEAGGMAKVAEKAFDYMLKGIGVLANGIQGLQIGWSLMKVALQDAALFIAKGLDGMARMAVNVWNAMPWTDEVQYKSMFSGFIATMESEVEESQRKMNELLARPLNSTAIEKFNNEAQRSFREKAEAVSGSEGEIQEAIITTDQVSEAYAKNEKDRTEKEVKLEEIRVTARRKKMKEYKQEQSDWEKALVASVERIDAAFADAWRGSFDSFTDFANNMIDGMKQLLAELAHQLITRPLVMKISAAITGAAGAAGASASTGGVTGGGGISSLFSGGFGAMGQSFYSGLGDVAGSLGFLDASSALHAKGAATTGLSMAGDFAGGMAGAYLGSKAFGETSGIGSTIGGIAGSVAIPIPVLGAAIGSFIGAGIESLFGQKNNGDNKGAADFDLSTGVVTGRTWGKTPGPENMDTAVQLGNQLKAIADAIGGSTFKGNITVGRNDGIEFAGKKFGQDVAGFFAEAFRKIVEGATQLDQPLKDLILRFEGSSEKAVQFASSLITIDQLSGLDTATQAIEDFNRPMLTMGEAYTKQTDYLIDMIAAYDGTAEAAANVANELTVNKKAAYDYALSIKAIGKSIQEAAAAQADAIRESVMSAPELDAKRRKERDDLRASLDTLGDPQKIAEAERRILELNNQLFQALPEELKKTQAEAYAEYAEQTATVTAVQLEMLTTGLVAAQADINTLTGEMLYNNAQVQTENTNKQTAAVDKFAEYIALLSEKGIAITIDGVQVAGGEVNK